MSLSNVYANGEMPVYISTPSNADLLQSPVYINTYYLGASVENCDYFYMKVGNSYKFYVTAPSVYDYLYRTPNVVSFQANQTYNNIHYSNITNYTTLPDDNTFPYIGEFSTVNAGLDYYIENGVTYPNQNPPIKSTYTIQNGWLTVIDLGISGTSYNYDLSTLFNVNSSLISQDWSDTSQLYWFSNTLPSAGDTYENIGTLIPWERGEPRNIFGQTKYGIYNLFGTSSGRYLYILNPFYRAIADNEHPTIVNYPVTVDGLLEGQKAYIYEMTATATVTGIVNAITTTTVDGVSTITNWGTTSGGAISSDVTNSFINTDTDTSTIQTAGGGNSNETAQTINDYLQQIQNVLDSFVTQVLGLLTAPISHIKQLISTGSEFMSTLGGLFTWLPAPVMSVIISALIVMVVIGVLKMFL